jgi:hypothetical protein
LPSTTASRHDIRYPKIQGRRRRGRRRRRRRRRRGRLRMQ